MLEDDVDVVIGVVEGATGENAAGAVDEDSIGVTGDALQSMERGVVDAGIGEEIGVSRIMSGRCVVGDYISNVGGDGDGIGKGGGLPAGASFT